MLVGSSGGGAKEGGLTGRSQVFRQRRVSRGPEWTPPGESRPRGLPGGGGPQREVGACSTLRAQQGFEHPHLGELQVLPSDRVGQGSPKNPKNVPPGEKQSALHTSWAQRTQVRFHTLLFCPPLPGGVFSAPFLALAHRDGPPWTAPVGPGPCEGGCGQTSVGVHHSLSFLCPVTWAPLPRVGASPSRGPTQMAPFSQV